MLVAAVAAAVLGLTLILLRPCTAKPTAGGRAARLISALSVTIGAIAAFAASIQAALSGSLIAADFLPLAALFAVTAHANFRLFGTTPSAARTL